MYKQKKTQCALTLFVPGKWDKSGVLAGGCPTYNTWCVVALMFGLSSASLWSVLCSRELWGVVCSMGGLQRGLGPGMDYGEHPSTPVLGKEGLGLGCSLWKDLGEEPGCCSWV